MAEDCWPKTETLLDKVMGIIESNLKISMLGEGHGKMAFNSNLIDITFFVFIYLRDASLHYVFLDLLGYYCVKK